MKSIWDFKMILHFLNKFEWGVFFYNWMIDRSVLDDFGSGTKIGLKMSEKAAKE